MQSCFREYTGVTTRRSHQLAVVQKVKKTDITNYKKRTKKRSDKNIIRKTHTPSRIAGRDTMHGLDLRGAEGHGLSSLLLSHHSLLRSVSSTSCISRFKPCPYYSRVLNRTVNALSTPSLFATPNIRCSTF